ncbi:SagB/ThcOx family dehydrogenase [Pseudomonas sp. ZM23]|uniref:SagB/ThcOx family dehydrogenase n=1 Tax=Pseudomonas triclosanedens TaxID=2961893 RepID=A0ABY6ZZR1_9PSED|nr:SagB/ThcOx family dehydrogenase [Pseudomonas triclosanedens]MCP8464033.1 SagB/ThcOx family dehydrogenase [Pseudomonas triclosanedens]MCP8469117.1 SagB/ThcOx family dehydrogenase [Pseudomonas triclosanedens]MCP8475839.1 SagB/ThcOx family dehydrogenase [Pseudomonas triclosanedens]WAI50457.1 SagB/ThcOx family dehydrogenase [Pseudomonas triclosanedens]
MNPVDGVRAYHELSRHLPERFAPGPGRLDWATQPAPFRRYAGARCIELLHRPQEESPGYDDVFSGPLGSAAPIGLASVSQLLYDSLALSAWKESQGNRWALRVNPSSGNLHPTEAYLLLPSGTVDNAALLAHYSADEHVLEIRAELPAELAEQFDAALPADGCLLALASIPWREAWKYGERAYRYCNHDLGHALACLSIAAAIQGWDVRLLRGVAEARLDAVFGLDREGFCEQECVDALLWIGPAQAAEFPLPSALLDGLAELPLSGAPNRLSREYRHWPELERVRAICRAPALPAAGWAAGQAVERSCELENPGLPLRPILHRRRSAQSMDGRSGILAELLYAWLRRLLPERSPVPFACSGEPARVDLLLFVHRVQGLAPGLYWLGRSGREAGGLREDFQWQAVAASGLPLYRLLEGDARGLSAFLSCGQDIASDGCVAFAMLADLDAALAEGAWTYPRLYWECGQIGQLLYLEAEAAGLSGTGIGCYFDPAVEQLLGDGSDRPVSLYHFTIGRAVWDTRLSSLPAYPAPRRPPFEQ